MNPLLLVPETSEDCGEEYADLAIDLKPIADVPKAAEEPDDPEVPPTVPVIYIQVPSRDHSEAGASKPNNQPAVDRVVQAQPKKTVNEMAEQIQSHNTDLVAILPQFTNADPKATISAIRVKRRKLALRKTRNVCARKLLLKASLGRQLAIPTKEALQRQARGEDVTIADIGLIT